MENPPTGPNYQPPFRHISELLLSAAAEFRDLGEQAHLALTEDADAHAFATIQRRRAEVITMLPQRVAVFEQDGGAVPSEVAIFVARAQVEAEVALSQRSLTAQTARIGALFIDRAMRVDEPNHLEALALAHLPLAER